MKPTWRVITVLAALVVTVTAQASDELFDRVEDVLSWNTSTGSVRGRVSGLVDLEGYAYGQPAPGLIDAAEDTLFVPRLTVFLDVQVGPRIYAFVQARADRGFDPTRGETEPRMDEYAVRFTPWEDGRLSLQAGKFSTVVGNWIQRHSSWENPFVSAPLTYENLTGMWDNGPPGSAATLLAWSHVHPRTVSGAPATDKALRLPVVWGPAYAHGFSASGKLGRFTYAAELKNAALSARPRMWESARFPQHHETWGARVGFIPDARWNLGLSASTGSYLEPAAARELSAGRTLGDYRQIVVAHDVSFAWRHLQVWAEVFMTRFEIPGVGDADTLAYYVEVRRKFTPRFFGAVRWNESLYARFPHGMTGRNRWGENVRRLDLAPVYRFTPHVQVKVQYSVEFHEVRSQAFSHWAAVQFTTRF